MKVAASHVINAPRDVVWAALQDPAVLARTLPGCRQLEVLGPDRFGMTLDAGVASIKGTYRGTVELSDKCAPEQLRMRADASGGPGTISADTVVRLESVDGGTRIEYDTDAIVGGVIGGVGQRVLVGVTKKTAGEFFTAIEQELLHGPTVTVADGELPSGVAPGTSPSPEVGRVFAAAPGIRTADRPVTDLLLAGIVGAFLALAGVLVGRRIAR